MALSSIRALSFNFLAFSSPLDDAGNSVRAQRAIAGGSKAKT